MEQAGLKIATCVFERMVQANPAAMEDLLQKTLFSIFSCLHFYRNNTKSKVIPNAIMRNVHAFFANFMISHSSQKLVEACDKI